MTTLFGGGTQSAQPVAAKGITIQTSVYGVAVQKGYGTNRAASNLIWLGGFQAVAQGGGGGKGGASGAATGYLYYTWFAQALGCGPISGIRKGWRDKNVYASFAAMFGGSHTLFTGTYPQSPWSYYASVISPQAGAFTSVVGGTYTTTRNYFIKYTFVTASGETLPSAEMTFSIRNTSGPGGIHNLLMVSRPANNTVPGTTGYNIYVGLTSGSEQKQNSTPIPLTGNFGSPTTSWTEPSSGLLSLGAPPGSDTSGLSQALNYNGIAYVGVYVEMGTTPTLQNMNYEVQWGSFVSGSDDADASLVVTDMLTNAHDGIQFPSGFLGSTTDMQNYVLSAGLLISPLYTQQQAIAQTITDLCQAINVAPIWTSGQLSFIPYGDTAISGNAKSWTPPASVFDFNDDDFQLNQYASGSAGSASNTDPVIITRPDQSKVINSITLEYYDRTNNYNPATVQYKNLALITQFGETPQQTARDGHMFCLAAPAQISAMLQGNRELGRNIYQWTLDQRGILYDPMDWGYVSVIEDGVLTKIAVRVLEITENDDETFTFMAEDYLQGTGHSPGNSTSNGSAFNPDYNEDPGNTNAPVIFEAPSAITTNGGLETWMAISGANPNTWGGAQIWVSTNNLDYGQVGEQKGSARTGTLVTAIASGDTSITVNLGQSQGALTSGSAADAANGTTLCYLDGEFISYQTATLISPFTYTLTGCVRGFYGSVAASHAVGTAFARLDSQIFKYPHSKLQLGQALSIKLLSFNIFGGGQQSL